MNFSILQLMLHVYQKYRWHHSKNEADLYVLIWKDVHDKSFKGKKQGEEQSRE